jgi:hypothetical protein
MGVVERHVVFVAEESTKNADRDAVEKSTSNVDSEESTGNADVRRNGVERHVALIAEESTENPDRDAVEKSTKDVDQNVVDRKRRRNVNEYRQAIYDLRAKLERKKQSLPEDSQVIAELHCQVN